MSRVTEVTHLPDLPGVRSPRAQSRVELFVRTPRVIEFLRVVAGMIGALVIFGVILVLQGKNPFIAYKDILHTTLGSSYGFSEVLVQMIPLLLCALAVSIPARVGLVNVGGEGQLYMGGLFAAWGALNLDGLSRPLLIAVMLLLACLGGALWAGIAAVLRAKNWLNEAISTLLMNYVAILVVQYFVQGPWRAHGAEAGNYPQSAKFSTAAWLPTWGSTRVHLALVFGLIAVGIFYFVLRRTRWGFEMRAIGGNPEASRRLGLPISRYIIIALMVGGAVAGIAGLGEVAGTQHRLRKDISAGYGYVGFLISWLAGHSPLGIVAMSFLLAVITSGGDSLQINQHLPGSAVNLLIALTLFMVLAQRGRKKVQV
ncbi:MAG: ABC transporter permease [Dehalococcoidia bacterium]